MNWATCGFTYADQAAAEHAAADWRSMYLELLDRLESLNESVDSMRLGVLVADERKRVRF